MHRTVKAEPMEPLGATERARHRKVNALRREYGEVRLHEALELIYADRCAPIGRQVGLEVVDDGLWDVRDDVLWPGRLR